MNTFEAKNISISISRPFNEVYMFISNPMNLPKWATGLSGSIENVNGDWIAESPMGKVKIKFAESNKFGVVDHDVTLDSGITFHNPMRVLSNKNGSEVIFTLFRQADMTAEKFTTDADWVKKDLEKLKAALEL
ncbi:MAG: SRPBCC family protein [Bdellovibrionota bacterium]